MYNNPYKAYQKTQVTTASPEKVLLMLYEGAIRFTKLAASRIREKKIAEKGVYISKALAIISELSNTLNHNIGGQLSADLENLYVFMIDTLIEANINMKAECCDNVEKLLITLYEAWKDVVNNPRADGVPSETLQPELYQQWQKASSLKEGLHNKNPPSTSIPPRLLINKITIPPRKTG